MMIKLFANRLEVYIDTEHLLGLGRAFLQWEYVGRLGYRLDTEEKLFIRRAYFSEDVPEQTTVMRVSVGHRMNQNLFKGYFAVLNIPKTTSWGWMLNGKTSCG